MNGANNKKAYSNAFENLVKDRQDLPGAIAYALYKADKREYIRENNLTSDDSRVKEFHTIALREEAVIALKKEAGRLIAEYISSATADAEKRANERFLPAIEGVKSHIDKRTGFWMAVWASIVATILFALILTTAVWLNKNQQNPLGGLYQMLHEGTGGAPAPAASQPQKN